MKGGLLKGLVVLLCALVLIAGLPSMSHGLPNDSKTDVAPQAAQPSSAHQKCHGSDQPPADGENAAEAEPKKSCCDAGNPCDHDECSCACPVMSHAVPMRRLDPYTVWHHPRGTDPGGEAPRHITSPLLRPPRA
jgi:hypothetical protein